MRDWSKFSFYSFLDFFGINDLNFFCSSISKTNDEDHTLDESENITATSDLSLTVDNISFVHQNYESRKSTEDGKEENQIGEGDKNENESEEDKNNGNEMKIENEEDEQKLQYNRQSIDQNDYTFDHSETLEKRRNGYPLEHQEETNQENQKIEVNNIETFNNQNNPDTQNQNQLVQTTELESSGHHYSIDIASPYFRNGHYEIPKSSTPINSQLNQINFEIPFDNPPRNLPTLNFNSLQTDFSSKSPSSSLTFSDIVFQNQQRKNEEEKGEIQKVDSKPFLQNQQEKNDEDNGFTFLNEEGEKEETNPLMNINIELNAKVRELESQIRHMNKINELSLEEKATLNTTIANLKSQLLKLNQGDNGQQAIDNYQQALYIKQLEEQNHLLNEKLKKNSNIDKNESAHQNRIETLEQSLEKEQEKLRNLNMELQKSLKSHQATVLENEERVQRISTNNISLLSELEKRTETINHLNLKIQDLENHLSKEKQVLYSFPFFVFLFYCFWQFL